MAASGWDLGQIYSTAVLPPEQHRDSHADIEQRFFDFIQDFRLDRHDYIYRDQLRANVLVKKHVLEVDVGHLVAYDERLAQGLKDQPSEYLPLFENATRKHARRILTPTDPNAKAPDCQVTLTSDMNITHLRHLEASFIGKLVKIPGIVIGASALTSKAVQVHLQCRACRHVKVLAVPGGFAGLQLPRRCDSEILDNERKECPMDPYVIVHSKCLFVDQQTLKLQEAPDLVPVGELPRHVLLNVDRNLVNLVTPGTRVTIMGIYSIFQAKATKSTGGIAVRSPYIRVVGVRADLDGVPGALASRNFSDEEIEMYERLARQPNIYETFASSIAPSIYGKPDIKKAIACMLFGGSRKSLPDNMRLRGDINVLLLGDPSTAKSQLLKFVEKVAPVAVYTSGKGSSAAGLTASVIRDPSSREFYLEGGAMVLADGGVVCIDEFDKMREEDRVAIHEAMEQQTISIAKAGITTVLNSRTSVLAAANPVFGRYDDMKSPGDNIDFQTTILSRFDMIFIVKDEHNEDRDKTIARHVINVHMNRVNPQEQQQSGELDIPTMRGFLSYCRRKCAPRLTSSAAERLSSHFVQLRAQVRGMERDMGERSTIPITVRQLEAIIRISESLAKMRLSAYATEQDVEEAIRLFKHSTMDATQSGATENGLGRSELLQEVRKIEAEIRRRLPIGSQIALRALRDDFTRQNYNKHAVDKAIQVLISQETLHYRNQRLTVYRAGV